MIHKVFTIYDQKAKAHLLPFFLPETAMAQRTFTDCINSDTHAFGRHPSDYTLIEHGTYDDSSALIEYYKLPNILGSGIEYIEQDVPHNQMDIEDHGKVSEESPQVSNDSSVFTGTEG